MNRSQLHRLRKNENVTVLTLDRLCNILSCELDDIAEHIPDDNDHF
ncbi:MAG: helix-turn-helix transcriptional regulator [Eubacterium sp.]|nr:helix-turn-helix transcriptional regulator [Eubacterium sp.]